MMRQLLILTALAALVAYCESYGFTPDRRDKIMVQLMDQRLQKNNVSLDASNEQIYNVFKKMNAVHDYAAQMELVPFIAAGSILVDQSKIDCTEGKFTGINMMQAALERNQSRVSAPLRRYIAEASNKLTEECLKQLSANNWKAFDDVDSEHVQTVEAVLGDSFDHPDKINGDQFWIDFEARELADSPDAPALNLEGGNIAHQRFEKAVDSALVLLKNLGEPVPFEKFSHKPQMLYTAYLILENLKVDNERLLRLADMHPDVYIAFTTGQIDLRNKYGSKTNQVILDTCDKLGLEKKTLSLAKTDLTSANAWRGAIMARTCYDAILKANQKSQ